MFTLTELAQAAKYVHHFMEPTPQYNWSLLSQKLGCEVWVKHENHTPTAAFKVRGGLCLLRTIMRNNKPPIGIISATRGNHGQSLSYAAGKVGLPVTIVVPENNNSDQNLLIKSFGANLVTYGKDFEEARLHSFNLQQEFGYQAIAPFERELVLGVATYAFEFFNKVKDLDTIYVPIGMGSGICGLIKTRDLLGLNTKIVGVVSSGADAFAQSFNAGKIITTNSANTLADGVATRTPMAEPFDIIKQGASRVITVTDKEIAQAMYMYYQSTHNLSEGAGAVSLAGLVKEKSFMKDKKVGVILSGGNIDFLSFSKHIKSILLE